MIGKDAIRSNFQQVTARIEQAARSVGREPQSIRLVVVTKAQPVEVVRAAVEAGACYLGENYVEEAIPKITAIVGAEVEWHMIGHIQRRKAGLVCQYFQYAHSLDSLKLAERINRLAGEQGKTLPVLLEINVSGEESKYGWPAWQDSQWSGLLPEFEAILNLPNLEVRGLMTVAPYFETAELVRPYYRRLRLLQEYLNHHIPSSNWNDLSMGMSGDFEIAVQEGATWVRIGQSILGPRPTL